MSEDASKDDSAENFNVAEMESEDSDDSEMEEDDAEGVEEEEEKVERDEEEKEAKAFVPGNEKLEEGEELVVDEQAYVVYHQAHLGPPCLSFDVIPDDQGDDRSDFPMSLYGVAGTQAAKVNANSIIAFKMFNLHPVKGDEEDEDNEEDDKADPEKQSKLKVASIKHDGPINRIRYQALGSAMVAAAWAENGSVGIWSLNECLQKLDRPHKGKEWHRETSAPLFQFKGHLTEGFAINWSPTNPGVLATGDCRKNIHVWTPTEGGAWSVDQRPFSAHSASVEDIQWSPNEANVMASCSVDKSIRIWDCRAKPDKACMITVVDSHDGDVNVIDWNKNEPFIASGGDDGYMKVWDLRQLEKGEPVATFKHHSGPITSVEWHPQDSTVLASSGADDQIALWDLAIERDEEAESAKSEELKNLPPQLLFIHQGLKDVKELHWHRQIPGLVMSTSHSGFDVFRTISV